MYYISLISSTYNCETFVKCFHAKCFHAKEKYFCLRQLLPRQHQGLIELPKVVVSQSVVNAFVVQWCCLEMNHTLGVLSYI